MTPTSGIVFFDIDGTLVPSGSSSSYLAAHLGHQPQLDAAEDRYARGELSNQQVSEIDAAGWPGARVDDVDLLLEKLPLIPGIDDVLAWCRAHSLEPVLASIAWQPVSAALARRHGFTVSGGPRMGIAEVAYDGTVAEHFDEYDKRDRALDLARQRSVPIDRCTAVGDSRSDIPLFQAVPASLALNATAAARNTATNAIDATDLREILPWLEQWHSKWARNHSD
jgi:phosphoserine phosphatase